MSDHDDQATAVSIVVSIRRLGIFWYRLLFLGARKIPWVTAPMRREQFIHFCHWMIVTNLPDENGRMRRLRRPVLWFESNYDGDVVRYMDTFARVIPWRMRAAWTPTCRFPDLFPAAGFHQWTIDNAYETAHYWSAYPDATTRDVSRALRMSAAATKLSDELDTTTPEAFERSWTRFLAENQRDL